MVTDMFSVIINQAVNFMNALGDFSEWIVWFFFSPYSDVLAYYDPLNVTQVSIVINNLGLGDFTLFSLLTTVGIGFYLFYQFAKWVTSIV